MRLGTCSWKYPEWEELVYSHTPENMLAEYGKKYSTVEIDQWFWSLGKTGVRLPNIETAREYAESVDDNFTFTVKLPDSISLTHHRDTDSGLRINPDFLSTELLKQTMDQLGPILPKSSVLMLQFEYLNKQKMTSRSSFFSVLEDFLNEVQGNSMFTEWPSLGIEIRNPQYYSHEYFSLLSRYKISPVLTHGYYLPPVFETIHNYSPLFSRDVPVVLRLHGPDRNVMDRLSNKTWNRIIRPMDDDLQKLIPVVNDLLHRGIETIINVNNHYEGCAPLSIQKILKELAAGES